MSLGSRIAQFELHLQRQNRLRKFDELNGAPHMHGPGVALPRPFPGPTLVFPLLYPHKQKPMLANCDSTTPRRLLSETKPICRFTPCSTLSARLIRPEGSYLGLSSLQSKLRCSSYHSLVCLPRFVTRMAFGDHRLSFLMEFRTVSKCLFLSYVHAGAATLSCDKIADNVYF